MSRNGWELLSSWGALCGAGTPRSCGLGAFLPGLARNASVLLLVFEYERLAVYPNVAGRDVCRRECGERTRRC